MLHPQPPQQVAKHHREEVESLDFSQCWGPCRCYG